MRYVIRVTRWIGVVLLFSLEIIRPVYWNQWSLLAIKAIFQEPLLLPVATQDYQEDQGEGCRQVYWWPGLMAGLQGHRSEQREDLLGFLVCTQNSIPILMYSSDDAELAQTASRLYTDDPQVSYWLTSSFQKIKIDKAIIILAKFAKSNPTQGAVACRLGTLYAAKKQFDLAETAFLTCCQNGNPYREGCLNAGLLMENQGNPQKAVEYYRLSSWGFDLKRADALEKKKLP